MMKFSAVLALAVAIFAGAAGGLEAQAVKTLAPAAARPAPALDGQWSGGFANAKGAQVTIAGGAVIGLFWRGDYRKVAARPAEGSGELAFAWEGGDGAFRRDAAGAWLVLREAGRSPVTISLARD